MKDTAITVVSAISALLSEAPEIAALAQSARDFFSAMAGAGLITIVEQNRLFEHVDQVCRAALADEVPPEFTVEADPSEGDETPSTDTPAER